MNQILKISELTFKYDDKEIFNNLNLVIKEGTFTTLLGPNGSGKTTLLLLIMGNYSYRGNIELLGNNGSIFNFNQLNKKISIVFSDQELDSDTAFNSMLKKLDIAGWNEEDSSEEITRISTLLKIDNLINKQISDLSSGEKQLMIFAQSLLGDPYFLIYDDAFSMMDYTQKDIVFKTLKKMHRAGKNILNITHDVEEALHGKDVVILSNGNIQLHESMEKAFLEEKKFIDNHLRLPFMAELSLKLKYYGLVDKIILSEKKLVDCLWK